MLQPTMYNLNQRMIKLILPKFESAVSLIVSRLRANRDTVSSDPSLIQVNIHWLYLQINQVWNAHMYSLAQKIYI